MATKPPAKRKRPGASRISPEGRARIAERTKERHAKGELDAKKNGALGGRGNTREKRRAAQDIAEHLRTPEIVRKLRQVIEDGLDEDQAMGTRLKTLEVAMKIEGDEAGLALKEEQADAKQMGREEIIAALKEGLSKGRMRAMLAGIEEPMEDAEVVDATFEEVDEAEAA